MKKMIILILGLVLALSMTGKVIAFDNPSPLKIQAPTACPVMGGQGSPYLSTVHNDRRVNFCCPSCVEIFKNNPDKYLKKQQ